MENEDDNSKREWLESKITPTALHHFFASRGITPLICHICHKTEFTIPSILQEKDGTKKTKVIISETYKDNKDINIKIHNDYQYSLVCKNCGCQNFFSVEPVVSWFRDGPIFEEDE